MNNYVYELLIVLISSGALGTVITSISKKQERRNMSNIEKVVDNQTSKFKETLDKLQTNQKNMAECLEAITNSLADFKIEMKDLKRTFRKFKSESEELDLFTIQKLREKKIFNGESEEFVKKLLSYKKQEEEEKWFYGRRYYWK